ncbi:MAG TPA: tetratricopeptide repeat protein [Casimicrobiaceae bacterium]|nr:tetratricopeptide repeat protein [Casimicrobiaceae bacterium]
MQAASRLLGLPKRVIDGLIAAGFVVPSEGPRGQPRLNFQDLVVLRAAQGLAAAALPARRIARALTRLREQLPDVPPGRLRVEAVGKTIVVREGDERWVADSGQYLLAFEVAAAQGEVRFINRVPAPAPTANWFEQALDLEERDPRAAPDAYRRAIAQDAACSGAYANLGRILHAQGKLDEAQALYEAGLRACDADATLLFNLAVLLEDRGALDEAAQRYLQALALEPDMADAHCNLGLLYERTGNARAALRHLSAYRQLTRVR